MPNFGEYYQQPFDIGTRRAKEYLFEGTHFLSGREAEKLGFVNRAVPGEMLDSAVEEYVKKVVRPASFRAGPCESRVLCTVGRIE